MNTCNIVIEGLTEAFEENPRELQKILLRIVASIEAGEHGGFEIEDSYGKVCGKLWYSRPEWKYTQK